jgi:hypothetical protein
MRENGSDVSASDHAMMLGIRHKCGQEIQFWIPVDLVAPIIGDVDESEIMGLAGWMQEQGFSADEEPGSPDALVEQLKEELAPHDVAFIHVERDSSICPGCGSLIRWLDAVTEYAQMRRGGET